MSLATEAPDLAWAYCPLFQHSVELIGRRWSGAIIRVLLNGPMRFSDILAGIPSLSDRLLSERLRELEAEAVVVRTVYPEVPVRVEYSLSDKGRELDGIIAAIDAWGGRWRAGGENPCQKSS